MTEASLIWAMGPIYDYVLYFSFSFNIVFFPSIKRNLPYISLGALLQQKKKKRFLLENDFYLENNFKITFIYLPDNNGSGFFFFLLILF